MKENDLTKIATWLHEGCNGRVLTERYTRSMDLMIQDIYQAEDIVSPVVLIATGGYGRAELSPFSDIDIMIFAKSRSETDSAEKILYKLWDTGRDISHSFRTAEECIDEAKRDIKTRTSLLESRYIAGDRDLYQYFRAEVYPEIAYKRQKDFVREKLQEMEKRHLNTGESAYLLEPHIKEGEGGLRDIHSAFWLSRVALRLEGLSDFVRILSPYEYKVFMAAYDFMLRTRFCLHIESRRKNDVLSFEYQKNVACRLGFQDSRKFSASERMLRYYYLKSRSIKDISRKITVLCSRHYVSMHRDLKIRKITDDFSLSGGMLITTKKNLFAVNPDKIMEVYALYSKTGKKFSDTMQDMIRTNLVRINSKTRTSPEAVHFFKEIFRGSRVYETLREMHESGVLSRFVPEFGALTLLVVHEPYHMYTVDEHTLMAIRNLDALRNTHYKHLEDLHDIMNGVVQGDTLFMALLLHDIGKSAGRRHEEEGYKRLKNIMERLNMDSRKRIRIEFLVRNHVLMSRIALHRETTDIDVIAGFADAVGDIENLKAIYLITYADMSAVNPGFWTSWKAFLLKELFEQTRDYLLGVKADAAEYIKFFSSGSDTAGLIDFIHEMPDRYFIGTPKNIVMQDYNLVQQVKKNGFAMRMDFSPDGLVEMSLSAKDSPGLFARIVGYLASKGLDIVRGRIFTGKKGIVIDKITISNWKDLWWEGLAADLEHGLTDIIVHDCPLNVVRRGIKNVGLFDIFIELDNETSDEFSIIEIFSPDRLGLLYDVAEIMHAMGINIVSARIHTEAGLAQDVFYVEEKKAKISYKKTEEILAGLWSVLKG